MAKENNKQELEIGFGTVFTAVKGNLNNRYVVADLESENKFTAWKIINFNGDEALGLGPGTFGVGDIREVIDVWSKERVIAAVKNHRYGQISDDLKDLIEEYSTQPGRIITR